MVRSGGIPVHLETMEPGTVYCVKAQAFVRAIGKHSAFSQAECVKVQGKDGLSLPWSPAQVTALLLDTLIVSLFGLTDPQAGCVPDPQAGCVPVVKVCFTLIALEVTVHLGAGVGAPEQVSGTLSHWKLPRLEARCCKAALPGGTACESAGLQERQRGVWESDLMRRQPIVYHSCFQSVGTLWWVYRLLLLDLIFSLEFFMV